jgi:hypothetical protein
LADALLFFGKTVPASQDHDYISIKNEKQYVAPGFTSVTAVTAAKQGSLLVVRSVLQQGVVLAKRCRCC